MKKKIILSIGLPFRIKNNDGKTAIIKLNSNEFVVCRYSKDNSVYLNDANLKGWYPSNIIIRFIYKFILLIHKM